MKTPTDQIVQRNGGWCWYQDPRVIVDEAANCVLFATVANLDGYRGEELNANIDVNSFDLGSGDCKTVTLANIPTGGKGDDHNVAALWQRPDGRYLAVYTGHNYGKGLHGIPKGIDTHPDQFYRISVHPHDAAEWGPEQVFRWPSTDETGKSNAVTYANLHHLSGEGGEKGRLYNIGRASGQRWQIATSDDWGESWTYRGMLSAPPPGGRGYSQGYVKFSDNGTDRIDFIITEAHPRDFNNGIYHGYIQNGKTYRADGTVVDEQTFSLPAPQPEMFTPVFPVQPSEPEAYHTAWTVELSRTDNGRLVGLFLTRYGTGVDPELNGEHPGADDHRLYLAEYVDGVWKTEELSKMGSGLCPKEQDYTGLGVIDRKDGNTVYVSTPIDPESGAVHAHHELFKGVRTGGEWTWSQLTEGSSARNLRPQLAHLEDGNRLLLWIHGVYDHQTRYNTCVKARRI